MTQARNRSDSSLRYWHVVEELRHMLKDAFASRFKGLVLYGSHARGEQDNESDVDLLALFKSGLPSTPTLWRVEESDIDLLVLFKDKATARKVEARVNDLALRLSSEHNILVSTVIMGEREYYRGRSPFFLNVKREGILIVPDEIFDVSPEITRLLEMARESLAVACDIFARTLLIGTPLAPTNEMTVERNIFARVHYGFAASRAYYAMFYAAEAALLSKGLSYSPHTGVIAGFGQHFTMEGLLPPALHRSLQNAFRLRNQGDYSIEPLTGEMAESVLNDARTFVEAIENYIKSIFES